jgi:urea transport system substrate-binding protein
LVSYDGQSNDQFYAQFAQQIALRDRVAVVHAGLQSSSREVIRPIFRRSNALYFWPLIGPRRCSRRCSPRSA